MMISGLVINGISEVCCRFSCSLASGWPSETNPDERGGAPVGLEVLVHSVSRVGDLAGPSLALVRGVSHLHLTNHVG
jgi:hypothetical protein